MAEVKVDDRVWRAMLSRVNTLGATQVRVGVIGDAAERVHPTREDLTVGQVALVNEYGSRDGHVPQRSFIRSTFHDHPEEIAMLAERAALDVVERGVPAAQALDRAGSIAAELMQRQLLDNQIPPPNAAATIARKGSAHPLLDTGVLAHAISHAVVREFSIEGADYESTTVEESL